MRALCASCGFHHEVVRLFEDGHGDERRDIYQVVPLETCDRSWFSDRDVLEARAKFGVEAIIDDESDAT